MVSGPKMPANSRPRWVRIVSENVSLSEGQLVGGQPSATCLGLGVEEADQDERDDARR